MDHVAIMNKSLGLIEMILDGRKTIESRWLKTRSAPWLRVFAGETVYFKVAGGKIVAKADVDKVEYIDKLNTNKIRLIVKKYGGGGKINLVNKDYTNWGKGKSYCILIWLKNPKRVTPFKINKAGFGTGSAWLSVDDIDLIKMIN